MNRRIGLALLGTLLTLAAIAACSDSGSRDPAPTVRVRGVVADWKTGDLIAGAVVETVGITPAQTATADEDGQFDLEAIPINGFIILNVSAAGYVRTLSPAILVEDDDIDDVIAQAVSNTDATAFETGFAVTPEANRGVVLGRAETHTGSPIDGVSLIELLPPGADFDGPFFLDVNGNPGAGTETTGNGSFLFFNVSSGDIAVAATAANLAFEQQATVVIADAWSLVDLPGDGPGVGGSPTPTPSGTPGPQSWETDIYPIFSARGCTGSGCHRPPTNGGNLRLNQSADAIYAAVAARCNLADPPNSLLLIKPLFEAQPNHGGGNIFLTTADPDYQKILRWIDDGAMQN